MMPWLHAKICGQNCSTLVWAVDEREHFTVECDASDFAIAATLNQNGRPVAFMSRTLSKTECSYPTVDKEADAERCRPFSFCL